MQNSDLGVKLQREGYKAASITKRAISMAIDDFLISFLIVIAFTDSFAKAKTYEQLMLITDQLLIYIFIAYTLYHWIFIALYGKTIGKIVTNIKVLDTKSFDKPDVWRSFLRSLFRNFDEMFFYSGMMVAFFDSYNRALHDIIGRCVIVEDSN